MSEEMRPNSISPLPPQQGNELREDYDDDTPKNCRELSQDGVEAAERDEDFAEERFRVDRRKLEQLIRASEDEENAEEFFLKIMQATQTHIAWPSKLKIGAKSKKDPHIKISGSRDAVLEAKTRILASLDTKSLRVTLKMDVSHTEHSHVIGKGGNNIKRVMQDTGCHIHFPDSNRNNQIEKSNQVSVAGLCSAVEQARVKIRDLLPLVFMFDVPVSSANQLNPDFSPILDHIQQHYGVNISLKPHHQPYIRTVLIRGSVYNMKSARQAATLIFEHLTGRTGVVFGVSLLMDISPQHHLFIIGHGGAHINHIMQRTSTTIHFPDPNTTVPQKRGNIYISGTMPNVFMARQHLLDCLPLVLMFDLKDDADVDQAQISYMSEHLGVHIGIKPKPKQPSKDFEEPSSLRDDVRYLVKNTSSQKSVVIKSMERNVANMYEARQRILGIDEEIPVVTGLTFSASDLAGPNLHYAVPNTNKPDTVMVLPGHNVMPAFIPSAANSPGPVYRHVMMLPAQPPFQFPPSQLPPVLYSPPMFQTVPPNDHMHQHPITSSTGANSQTPASSTINVNHAMHNLKVNQPVEIMTDPQANLFPNINANCSTSLAATNPNPSASDVDQAISSLANLIMNHETLKNALLNHSENNSTKLLNRLIDSGGKDHHLSCNTVGGGVHYGLSTDDLNYHQPSSIKDHASVQFAHLDHDVCQHLGNLLSSNMQNGEGMMMEPGAESDSSSDHSSKAPGSNRPKKSVNSAVYFEEVENGMQADVDYQKLRFMADQAMQKKPSGESRIPTDYWAGLFFSKSMPQSAISEKLNNMSGRYTGPNMTTQYEVGEEDAENEGIWKETPSDPSPSLSNQLSPTESLMNLVTQLSVQTSGLSMPHKLFDQGDLQNKSSLWPISDQVQSSELGDLDPLFHEIGLSKYVNIFKQQEIDMSTFLTLDDKDLRDLGVTTFGARRKMLLAIADLNKKQSEIPPPPGLSNPFRDANLMRRHDVVSQSVRW